MAKKFVYFYFMKNMPEKIGEVIPLHIAYWKKQKSEVLSSPFLTYQIVVCPIAPGESYLIKTNNCIKTNIVFIVAQPLSLALWTSIAMRI